jgi:hypothetical protein
VSGEEQEEESSQALLLRVADLAKVPPQAQAAFCHDMLTILKDITVPMVLSESEYLGEHKSEHLRILLEAERTALAARRAVSIPRQSRGL